MKRSLFFVIILLFMFPAWAYNDAHFLDMMVEHFQLASEMGKLAQEKAQDSELKKLARKIVRHEKLEIKQMRAWRESYYPEEHDYIGPLNTKALSSLAGHEGDDFDKKFVEEMIEHHEDGIRLQEEARKKTGRGFIYAFVDNSIPKMKKEIEKLKELKEELGN